MEITVEKVDTGVQKLGFQALSTLKTVRVAVYARVSTDQEIQLHSLEEQMKAFRAKIAQHPGWMLVDVYADATDIIGLKQNPTNGRRFSPIFLCIGHFSE